MRILLSLVKWLKNVSVRNKSPHYSPSILTNLMNSNDPTSTTTGVTGASITIDDNGDSEGNYTVLAVRLSNTSQIISVSKSSNRTFSCHYQMVPIGSFDNKDKKMTVISFANCLSASDTLQRHLWPPKCPNNPKRVPLCVIRGLHHDHHVPSKSLIVEHFKRYRLA